MSLNVAVSMCGCDEGGTAMECSPVEVRVGEESSRVIDVSAGGMHTLCVTANGVHGFGDNTFGQLGIGKTSAVIDTSIPQTVRTVVSLLLLPLLL